MIDPQLLRKDILNVAERISSRGFMLDVDTYNILEAKRKSLQTEVESLQAKRTSQSKQIGQLKAKGEDVSIVMKEVAAIGEDLKSRQTDLESVFEELTIMQQSIPNIPHESVPAGKTEEDNVEIRRWGEPRQFDFEFKDHVDVGASLGGMDFELATKITGSRFVVLKKDIAKLHRALTQFMLAQHTDEHGYDEVYVPYLVNKESLYGTGQLPKFIDDQFRTQSEGDYFLIPTAEVPITNILRDTISDTSELPIKMVAHTPCFRREAGSYGRDTRGMIRQHQFEKVELVQAVLPEQSYQRLEELLGHAETILQKLELPYRVVNLCAGDLGFSALATTPQYHTF